MTVPSDRAPLPLRVARAIIIAQTVVAAVVTVIGLVFVVTATHGDDVARRSGNPNEYEGLGVAVGTLLVGVFGVIALASGAAAIGLCRSRMWGLMVAGVTECVMLLVAARSALSGPSPDVWLLVIVPSATVLASVLTPKCRAWCTARALA